MGEADGNAASDLMKSFADLHTDPHRLDELAALFTGDFVLRDRRKLVGTPEIDTATWLEGSVSFSREMGLVAVEPEMVAVSGDRLVLARWELDDGDLSRREFLAAAQLDVACGRAEQIVMFDLDDLDAPIKELDRLHARMETGDVELPDR